MQSLSVPSSMFPDVLQLDDSYVAATGKVIASAVYRRAPALYADSLAHATGVTHQPDVYALAAHLVCRGATPGSRRRVMVLEMTPCGRLWTTSG